ncbi:hypothetical protein Cadr_000022920 [Camelus dromedarius]|uniref:Snake toxin/toxin-like domain-containing protein n=1 Tax=Camelus dromedarius TaxID=9838 RepID=A0A5N4CGH2_CAMDR|nr:hypothetical protein Cadr_000022920 [Camelus dromedarius]
MTVLLALLLIMGMPWVETNITVSGRQRRLRCHVCEIENSFDCQQPMDCDQGVEYCSTAAVSEENLCNVEKPVIEENSEDKYREVGGAPDGQGSSARLVTLVALASALLGLRLP